MLPVWVSGVVAVAIETAATSFAGDISPRTRLDVLPEPRSTNDIDLFIRTEILVRLDTMQQMASCLERLRFEAVAGAHYFQWERPISGDNSERYVKLDLLVGPLCNLASELKTDKLPWVRPKGRLTLHARLTDEAIEIDTRSYELPISGRCTDGEEYATTIFIPPTFTYLMMKLFAYDDRKSHEQSDLGRHHAMDLYRIVAMMNEQEFVQTSELRRRYLHDNRVRRAQDIVAREFATEASRGLLRLREHPLFREEFEVTEFCSVLDELLGSR